MALTSTLFTGLSGLDVNQTRLNVVGNNIANVNTVAFKSSRTIFTPQFYVTDSAGSPTTSDFGGQNPSQRGLGAQVGAIQKDFSGGAIEPTGRATDMAIDGDGFFVVQGTERAFTRDGSFSLNASNQLVTNAGNFVMGYGTDKDGVVQVGQLSKLVVPLGDVADAQATANVKFQGNLSPSAAGASVLNSQSITLVGGTATPTATSLVTDLADSSANGVPLFAVGDTITVDATKGGVALPQGAFTVTATSSLKDLTDFYTATLGIDTANSPTGNGIPTPGTSFKLDSTVGSNAVKLVIAGNLGSSNAVEVTGGPFTFDLNGTTGGIPPIKSNPNGTVVKTSLQAFDSLGIPLTINITATLDAIGPAGATWKFSATSPDNVGNPTVPIGTGTIQFDTDGGWVDTTGADLTISRAGTSATTPQTITLNFESLNGLQDASSTLQANRQDGFAKGELTDFSVGADGIVTGSYTNGQLRSLGQVAIATFKNSQGLVDNGGNLYSASAGSGIAVIGTPNQLGAGSVRSGSLELSNVDLSKEFTNLIIASTGFSAASKVITTSDQLIQELLNTVR